MECVLQDEWSLLMQFFMKVTVGVLFLIEFVGNKCPEGSLIIQDLGGIEAEPCCCGYLLSFRLNL